MPRLFKRSKRRRNSPLPAWFVQWSDGREHRYRCVSGFDSTAQRGCFMVMRLATSRLRQRGALMVELLVAMALVAGALLPLAYSLASERRLVRATYQREIGRASCRERV